jgi:hypothetical protein
MTQKFSSHSYSPGHKPAERKPIYGKVFRWHLPEGQTGEPSIVEIAGTFSEWKKLVMPRAATGGWQLTLNIPAHRTHHYMFFADGKPVQDKHCDGLAIPHGAEEEQFAIETPRGPRVFMLFAQTK